MRSATFRISAQTPHLRFLAKYLGGGQADVRVDRLDARGKVTSSSSGSIAPDDHRGWAPSRIVSLDTSGMKAGETAQARLTISSRGSWLLDAVMVDPYSR